MVLKYLRDQITNYFETREAARFEKFMLDVRAESDRFLSHGDYIRELHASERGWRLN